MAARIVAAAITVARIEQTPVRLAARAYRDFGSVGIAILLRQCCPDGQPVSLCRADVAQQLGRAADLRDEQIGSAVVVEIADGQAAPDERFAAQGRVRFRDVAELPLTGVGINLVALSVA